MYLKEDSSTLINKGSVLKSVAGWAFDFFEDAVETVTGANDPAKYNLVIDVEEKCTSVVATTFGAAWIDTMLKFRTSDTEIIQRKIDEEEFDPAPLLILADGSAVTLTSQSVDYKVFKSEASFIDKKLAGDDFADSKVWFESKLSLSSDYEFPLWQVLAGSFALLVVIILVVVFCVICRKNKVDHERDQEDLAMEIAQAEREGIEVPDSLKKGMTTKQIQDSQQMAFEIPEIIEGKKAKGKGKMTRMRQGEVPSIHPNERVDLVPDELNKDYQMAAQDSEVKAYKSQQPTDAISPVVNDLEIVDLEGSKKYEVPILLQGRGDSSSLAAPGNALLGDETKIDTSGHNARTRNQLFEAKAQDQETIMPE